MDPGAFKLNNSITFGSLDSELKLCVSLDDIYVSRNAIRLNMLNWVPKDRHSILVLVEEHNEASEERIM